MELSIKKAKSIIKEASKGSEEEPPIYEGEMPDEDDEILEVAETLITQAEKARDDGWEDPAIDKILFLADVDGGSESDPNVEKDIDDILDGYDDMKVAAILAALPDLSNDDLSALYDYESENKDRNSVLGSIDAIADERQEEEEEEPEDDGDAPYTWSYVFELAREDLEDLIDEEELDVAYNRRTTDDALSEMICEALGIKELDDDPEPEVEDDPEPEEEEEPVNVSYEFVMDLDRDGLEDLIEDQELDVSYNKRTSDEKLAERICEALDLEPEAAPLSPPWRGYDSRKMEQIIKKLPKLNDEELAEVYDYEKENKNRKGIMKMLAEIAEERGKDEEEPEGEDDPSAEEGSEDAEGEERPDADAADDAAGEADGEGGEGREDESEKDAEAGYDPEHHELIREVQKRVEEEHFSIPKKLPREVVELPFDLTQESDSEIRVLHSAFTSYFARAAYVAKLEGQLADACKHIADKRMNEVLASLPRIDDETKKEKTATLLKAQAESHEDVELWRDRERTHRALSNNSKKDCDIYEKNLSSLSREWTMRHEELEHSGGLSKKRK